MAWTYRLRYVRCGKPGCRTDASGGHGPYWYGYKHRGNRVYSKYFGRRPTSSFSAIPPASAPPYEDRWKFHGRMDLRTALRIFGLDRVPNDTTLQARYRSLAVENHPDLGGDNRIMAAINVAYAYLRR